MKLLLLASILGDAKYITKHLWDRSRVLAIGRIGTEGGFSDYLSVEYSNSTSRLFSQTWNNEGGIRTDEVYSTSGQIVGAALTDMNGDGNNEILCSQLIDGDLYSIYLLQQDDLGTWRSVWSLSALAFVQPLILDINGDGLPDMLLDALLEVGSDTDAPKGIEYNRVVLINNWNFNFTITPWTKLYDTLFFDTGFHKQLPHDLNRPHSSAFVDINGDCLPDIVLDVKPTPDRRMLEIWLAKPQNGKLVYEAVWGSSLELPPDAGALSFVDANADGTLDIIFPFCDHEGCRVIMTANRQASVCNHRAFSLYSKSHENCIWSNHLCGSLWFEFYGMMESDVRPGFYVDQPHVYPLALREGDIFCTGYPDLFTITKNNKNERSRVTLLKNSMGVGSDPEDNVSASPLLRGFNETIEFPIMYGGIEYDALAVVPVDVEGKGNLSLLVYCMDIVEEIESVFLLTDFMDTSSCEFLEFRAAPPSLNNTKHAYGVSPGAAFKVSLITLDGSTIARVVSQSPQSAYTPLQSPYTYLALGRSNDFVEYIHLGVASHTGRWLSFLPNSRVTASTTPVYDSTKWKLTLDVKPSAHLLQVIMVVTVTLTVLGAITIHLDRLVRQEDQIEEEGFKGIFIRGR